MRLRRYIKDRKETIAILAASSLLALAGSSWATQEAARRFDYQPALTGRLFALNERVIYQPLAIWVWSKHYSRNYPRAFATPKLIAALSVLAALAILMLAFRRRPPSLAPFGEDAWATKEDAKRIGLFAEDGVVIGALGGEILCDDGPSHVLITGGTRAGKTRGAVIPTLLTWTQSALVLDIKDELFAGDKRFGFPGVAAYRQLLGPVLRLSFTAQKSAGFNVLECVRKGPQEVRDVQNIVEIIADPYGDGRHADFWDRSAKSVLAGLILHVLYAEEEKSLKRVFELLADLDETAKRMEAALHLKDPVTGQFKTHPAIARGAISYRRNHEKIRMGVKATAESYLTLFDDPLVQKHTARSDFSIDDLMCADQPVTLFLSWPPAESVRLKPLIRLALAAILHGLMERQDEGQSGKDKKRDLLLVLDEFPQLGRIDFFEKSLGVMAGYGLRAMLVTQSLNYVNQAYGAKNTILDNCAILAALGANDAATAETVAKLAGETYAMRPQETWSGKSFGLGPENRSVTYREEKRSLVLPGDVRAMPKDEQIIFVEGARPLRAQKLKYDQEPVFQARSIRGEIEDVVLSAPDDWRGMRGFGLRPPPLPKEAPKSASKASGDFFPEDGLGSHAEFNPAKMNVSRRGDEAADSTEMRAQDRSDEGLDLPIEADENSGADSGSDASAKPGPAPAGAAAPSDARAGGEESDRVDGDSSKSKGRAPQNYRPARARNFALRVDPRSSISGPLDASIRRTPSGDGA